MQHPSVAALLTRDALSWLPAAVKNYALFGRYDVYDLVAIGLGALAAIWVTRPRVKASR